jgi:hypothetical protein
VDESSDSFDIPPPTTATGPRLPVLVFRWTLLFVAAAAVAVALSGARAHVSSAEGAAARYVCPMHPDVTSKTAGTCPICRMELEPLVDTSSPAIRTSPFQTYDYVRRRGFGQGVRAPAWVGDDGIVVAVLYDDELEGLEPGARGSFSPSASPAALVPLRMQATAPERWDRSTSHVRFQVEATSAPLPAGDVGWVRLPTQRRELEVVPQSSVLESSEGPYVLVTSPNGRLNRRPIEVGRVLGDFAIVLSGLRLQERVSVRSAFVLDAERRLRRESSLEVLP